MTHAQDDPGFSGRAGLGFLATSGNSDTQSLNGNLDMWLNFDSWRHAVNAQAIKSKTSGTTTSEAIGWSWQSDYTINETDYIFGITAIDKDEFSTYDQQTRIALGYGRRVIDRERHVLNAEVGFGSRKADLRNKTSQDLSLIHI